MASVKASAGQRSPWVLIVGVILVLTFFSFGVVGCVSLIAAEPVETGNVAVIPIKGAITVDADTELFASGKAASTDIVKLIEKAEKDAQIKAIILDINSPGGGPVASAEIAQAIKKADKPTVAVIREMGASGGYWAASAADHIIAHELSITGSIGVFASYLSFEGLIADYNVTYEQFIAGKNKDMGNPFKAMNEEQKQIYQSLLDKMHVVFIQDVADNRGMTYDEAEALATGQIYLGMEALDNGLVDALGGKQEALVYIEEHIEGEAKPVVYQKEKSFLELLASAMDTTAFTMGTGVGAVLVEDNEGGISVSVE